MTPSVVVPSDIRSRLVLEISYKSPLKKDHVMPRSSVSVILLLLIRFSAIEFEFIESEFRFQLQFWVEKLKQIEM